MSFTAMYASLCALCDDWIEPGDEISSTDDGYAHADCAEEAAADDPFGVGI